MLTIPFYNTIRLMFRPMGLVSFLLILLSSNHSIGQTVLKGTVIQSETEETLEFANASLMSLSDSSMVTGGVADMEGRFELQADPGTYYLRLGYIGFQELWREVELEQGINDLGEIGLASLSEELGEIVVEAAASLFRSEFDRRVFSMENTVVAEGGTALQVLETLPSVMVDEEGNISMRGSGNIEIHINGRPTNLTSDDTESILEQFPADAIESLELITNPSARYDAEGVGGIINLVLKEERMVGFNGRVNTSAGTGHKYSGGVNLNYRTNNMNIFTNYSYQYRELWEYNESFRAYSGPNVSPYMDQDFDTQNYRQGHLIRSGFEYNIGQNSSARLFSNINLRSRDRERLYNIRTLDNQLELDSMFVRQLEEDQSRTNYEFGLEYSWRPNGNGNGQSLDARFSFSHDQQDRLEYFDQEFYNDQQEAVDDKRTLQTYERPLNNQMYIGQIDYTLPVTERINFEAGWRSTLRRNDLEQIFRKYDPEFGFDLAHSEKDDLITNQFRFDEDVHAAYLILQQDLGAFSYQAGLRAEYTRTESYQPAIDSTHTNNYFDFFPSIFLNYEISQNQDVQLNYSRRIRRPGTWALMPFINAQDFFNLRIGNPYLDAEYTNSFEVSYLRGWENYFLSASTYFRHTSDALSRVFELFDERYAIVTWINSDTRQNLGVELVNQFNFSQNADATLTGNFFHSEVSGVNSEGDSFVNSRYSWTLSLLSNVRIPNWFNVQVMGNYRGPIAVPQGSIKPVFGMSMGLRRNLWRQNATVSLNVSDIFNTQRFVLETDGSRFAQERRFDRETRILTLSLTYRFGGYQERERHERPRDLNGQDGLY